MRTYGVSQRRACRVVGQSRSSQRYKPRRRSDEQMLMDAIEQKVQAFPTFGYRRIHVLMVKDGFTISLRRTRKLLRQAGYRVPTQPRKKRARGTSSASVKATPAHAPNDCWAWDFVHSRDGRGKVLRWLVVVDEFTRECLVLHASRSIRAKDVTDQLLAAVSERGTPKHIRSDNGPEFVSAQVKDVLSLLGTEIRYVSPGSPWQNGAVESFNSKLRDEFLRLEEFEDLRMARELAAFWRQSYNLDRPHSALGYRTPAQHAAEYRMRHAASHAEVD